MVFRGVLLLIVVCVSSAERLEAQLFAPNVHSRRLTSADRRSSTGESTLFGADLGIRESRGAGAFVGADPTDATGFVGLGQVIAPVPVVAATESLQEVGVQNVNEVLAAQTAAGIYAPRLIIAFSPVAVVQTPRMPEVTSRPDVTAPPGVAGRVQSPGQLQFGPQRVLSSPLQIDASERVQAHLAKTLGIEALAPIQVSVENRIATLRGSVASADDRSRAELIASFEPGVDQVRNELTVQSLSSPSRE